MWWSSNPADEQASKRDLARRLRKLERLFPVEQIRRERLEAPQVQAYYAECDSAYRKHHSREGAMHMALNDGSRYNATGFAEHLRRIELGWDAAPPRTVLEIGFGQGFNLAWLAPRHPRLQFEGIDLTVEHLQLARRRLAEHTNVRLHTADLHRLPQPDASFDEVFSIEAFCYASDVPRALSEVHRVLRPGGRFTLFDGYQEMPTTQLDADAALATELVARGAALERFQVPAELLAQASTAGFTEEAVVSLDTQVLPNLRRLDRMVGAIIRFEWLARHALSRRAAERNRNVLSGYLMHRLIAMGHLSYRQIVLRKSAAA